MGGWSTVFFQTVFLEVYPANASFKLCEFICIDDHGGDDKDKDDGEDGDGGDEDDDDGNAE